jgi:hypothetical protein
MFSDIYGGEMPSTLAVSLGKISIGDPTLFQKADIAKSLMNMVAYNVA